MNVLAIIPARGGSKGIPHKNIRNLAGKPLIAYTIIAAKKSKLIDKIVVSTDDKKIAKISETDFGIINSIFIYFETKSVRNLFVVHTSRWRASKVDRHVQKAHSRTEYRWHAQLRSRARAVDPMSGKI